jgi:hypothetical protein
MEDTRARLQDALKAAMISKDHQRRDVLRMVISEMKQVEVDERRILTADAVVTILQREVKKRRESIDEARKAGREDIAVPVEQEVRILEEFLPEQLSREQIRALAQEAISASGATSAKEMGKVMAVLMPRVKGVADGKLVNDVVRELLSQ